MPGTEGGQEATFRDDPLHLAAERMQKDEAPYQALATGLPQMIFGCGPSGERTWPSPQWVLFTGLSEVRSLKFGWLEAIHPEDHEATLDAWERAPDMGEYLVEHRIQRVLDGEYRWHQTRAVPLATPILGPFGETVEWVGSSADVDDMRQLRERIAATEQHLRTLVDGVPQLLWRSCDMGQWTWASPQWLDFTGQSQEQSHGRGWLDAVHPDDREATMAAWSVARPHGILDVEFRVRRASDGTYLWHRTRSTPVRDQADRIIEWLGSTTDIQDLKDLQRRQQVLLAELQYHARDLEGEIRDRKQVEARLLFSALHDDLTKLRNRTFLMDRLRLALERKDGAAGVRCAVLFLDLDRFKLINDSLGHQAGDLLLIEVAKRLEAALRPQDTLARFGGDEFALLVEDADEIVPAVVLAEGIIAAMRRPFRIGQQEVFSSCSIGVVQASREHRGPEDVLRDADVAMYHAKRHGRAGYAVFTDAMRGMAVEALELRTDLRNAVARDEFYLHYQPICSAATGSIVGLEALVRWQHPRRGPVPPAAFIEVAEETGLIREIGRWVLWDACHQMRAWHDKFPGLDLRLNVNTSGEELKGASFAADLSETLSATGLDPRALQLEVTESIFLEKPEWIGEILDGIRALGVRIALDDFGTGYSSLSYLDRYEVDTIKIDRSFVIRMPTQPRTAAIVQTIVRLGHAMGLDVVAEGVEDDQHLQALRAVGCSLVQGFHLGRPTTAQEITRALAKQSGPRLG